jgi:nucleotide-binding universal stress UspA family protein
VLPVAAQWAVDLGIEITLVRVVEARDLAADRVSLHAAVDRLAQVLRDAGAVAEPHIEVSATPAQSIVHVATTVGASLIALATHGTGRFYADALGRTASGVVRHATVPVLVVPNRSL